MKPIVVILLLLLATFTYLFYTHSSYAPPKNMLIDSFVYGLLGAIAIANQWLYYESYRAEPAYKFGTLSCGGQMTNAEHLTYKLTMDMYIAGQIREFSMFTVFITCVIAFIAEIVL